MLCKPINRHEPEILPARPRNNCSNKPVRNDAGNQTSAPVEHQSKNESPCNSKEHLDHGFNIGLSGQQIDNMPNAKCDGRYDNGYDNSILQNECLEEKSSE